MENQRGGITMKLSPRLDDARIAAIAGAHDQPRPHTLAEISQMIRLREGVCCRMD